MDTTLDRPDVPAQRAPLPSLREFLTGIARELDRSATANPVGGATCWLAQTLTGLLEVHVEGAVRMTCECARAFCSCPVVGWGCEGCGGPVDCPTLLVAARVFAGHARFDPRWSV